jgi:hypothetical protein
MPRSTRNRATTTSENSKPRIVTDDPGDPASLRQAFSIVHLRYEQWLTLARPR